MITFDGEQIEAARAGNRAALESVARAAERPVFNLSMRMLANRADAEDATQEILIKIITHLGGLRDVNAAGGWAMRLATRELVNRRKQGRVEALSLDFAGFAADLDRGRRALATGELTDAETALALREVKTGCTLALLTCLSRPARMAYILGDILELTDSQAASILDITAATYRQRLSRARQSVTHFVTSTCGVVSKSAPCRCKTRIAPALEQNRIAPGTSDFGLKDTSEPHPEQLALVVRKLEDSRTAAALMRSNPEFPSHVSGLILPLLDTTLAKTSPV